MARNKGLISIISLLVMSIILMSSLFLLYISNLDYLILNSNKNSIQSYYYGESKVLKILYQDEYYYEELLPRIKTYLKYGYLGQKYSYKIRLDEKDLIEEDKYKDINISFLVEDNRRLLVLNTKSFYNNITKEIEAKINIIKHFYEMNNPILYKDGIEKEIVSEYLDYMDCLQEEITTPLDNDIMGIESVNFDNILIGKDLEGRKYIEFCRNTIDQPIMCQYINKDRIFLVARGPTKLFIKSGESPEKLILKGIMYIEGDIEIHNDLEFYGILIVNQGNIYISSNSKFEVEGLVLSRDFPFETLRNEDRIEINYNEYEIKTNGIYLPGFIEPKLKVIKGE